jgi:RNA recognition motif-containing protein
MNMYVGNLSFDVNDDELRAAFEAFGQVASATVIKDKYSGESRGFGFVEMPSQGEAQAAIDGLNGKELKGRTLNVGEARPRSEGHRGGGRPGGGKRAGGYGGGGGYGGKRKSGKGSRRGARNAIRERKASW